MTREFLDESSERSVVAHGPGWLALDKPSRLTSHNAAPGELDVIRWAELILQANPALRSAVRPEPDFRPAPAHRLDAGTSGVLTVACSRREASAWPLRLSRARKLYVAIAKASRGNSKEASNPFDRAWEWPLSDKAEGRRDPQGPKASRREARTEARLLERNEWFARFEATIETGRTHQIRRHAALAGLPLVGDRRYGDPKHADMIVARYGFDRLALHARTLVLDASDARDLGLAAIEAPEPEDFRRIMKGEGN